MMDIVVLAWDLQFDFVALHVDPIEFPKFWTLKSNFFCILWFYLNMLLTNQNFGIMAYYRFISKQFKGIYTVNKPEKCLFVNSTGNGGPHFSHILGYFWKRYSKLKEIISHNRGFAWWNIKLIRIIRLIFGSNVWTFERHKIWTS